MNGKEQEISDTYPSPDELRAQMGDTALSFRGYNVTNLGRTYELLTHPIFGPNVERHLRSASEMHADITGHPCDLVARVRDQRETTLESYAEAISLIMATSAAQLDLLERYFDINFRRSRLTFGYSLGEILALVASEMLTLYSALKIPLALADDCVALATDVTLAVLFSRGAALPLVDIQRICAAVNQEGHGVIGVSSVLSPNSVLLIGQGSTLDCFERRAKGVLPDRFVIRKNPHAWPPLHTPIVWQRNISDRAAVLLHTLRLERASPQPPVLSLVTGEMNYNDHNARDILRRWIDEPQQLWSAVCETLSAGIQVYLHVGPEPNIIPATFRRLRENVIAETQGRFGMRALSAAANRPWLRAFLPERTAILRAAYVRHFNLEDWLLAQEIK